MTGPIQGPYRVGPTGSNEFERFVIATAPDGSALYVAAVRTPMQSDGSKYDTEGRDATAALLAASWSMREALENIRNGLRNLPATATAVALDKIAADALAKADGAS